MDNMAKKMLIDATHAEETRVVVVDGNKVEEFDFESENKRQLAGNIYLAKVTRVEPSLQAAFVDYGGNRHGFLAFAEIHPDYYQIPVADREALMEEERAYAEAQRQQDEDDEKPKRSRRRRGRAQSTKTKDVVEVKELSDPDATGMETIDLSDDSDESLAVDLDDLAALDAVDASTIDATTQDPTPQSDDATAQETVSETEDMSDADDQDDDADDTDSEEDDASSSAAERDDEIESVAEEDDSLDLRPVRKQRPRRYKIQEVIKVRQIMLVQVVKEERGNKGAALTTYLSLAGRYCVLMPNTARGGGISRKITNAVDRKKLKEIAHEIDVPTGAGLIIRTAGAKRTKTEIKRDYEYLQRLWEQIRELTLQSIAPAKIYEEGDLIKRSIRDLYNREIDEVFVEGDRGYRIAKDFMKMIMPSHAKNVKNYTDPLPLFARYQVESYLNSMFNPVVQLKSGGYIVIGVTEALVAIDVNSGRATKEGSIEETALKTNLEAAEEVARQLRLRDLAGLIVIDFIDMDERRNNASVEKRIKDKLKTDRARIQVGRISGFGLMEMSRQRLRPGMIEATTQGCPHCHGTGLIRSDDNLALSILRQIEEEGVRRRSREVLVKCPVAIANYLMNQKREHIAQIEARYGLSVRVEGDPSLVSPDFVLEKFKTATRVIPEPTLPVVSVDAMIMDQIDEEAIEDEVDDVEDVEDIQEDEQKPKKRRRRRRRRKGGGQENGDDAVHSDDATTPSDEAVEKVAVAADAPTEDTAVAAKDDQSEVGVETQVETPEEAPAKKPRRTRTRKPKASTSSESATSADAVAEPAKEAQADASDAPTDEKPAEKPKRKRAPRKTKAQKEAELAAAAAESSQETAPVSEPSAVAQEPVVVEVVAVEPEVAPAEPVHQPEPAQEQAEAVIIHSDPVVEETPKPTEKPKPKRKGWWSLG